MPVRSVDHQSRLGNYALALFRDWRVRHILRRSLQALSAGGVTVTIVRKRVGNHPVVQRRCFSAPHASTAAREAHRLLKNLRNISQVSNLAVAPCSRSRLSAVVLPDGDC